MKYYYITENFPDNYEKFGSSKLGVSASNIGLSFDSDVFWEYPKNIKLDVYASDKTQILKFLNYVRASSLRLDILLMIPELKIVFEKFSMPNHKWYQAEAGYNLEYVHNMKRFHNIEYDININEKREYWVFQMINNDSIKQLDYPSISFDLINFNTRETVDFIPKNTIKTYDEYVAYTEGEYHKRKCVLKIKEFIYRKNYDILWGRTEIVFNDKVKAALEATNIITPENGLEFVEFTDYEIQMLGE